MSVSRSRTQCRARRPGSLVDDAIATLCLVAILAAIGGIAWVAIVSGGRLDRERLAEELMAKPATVALTVERDDAGVVSLFRRWKPGINDRLTPVEMTRVYRHFNGQSLTIKPGQTVRFPPPPE